MVLAVAECLEETEVDARKVKPRYYLSVPSDMFGIPENWSPADRQWGYVFGTYELWNTDQVRQFLASCEKKTIERLTAEGKLRSRRTAANGGRRLYCSRSVAMYAASLKE